MTYTDLDNVRSAGHTRSAKYLKDSRISYLICSLSVNTIDHRYVTLFLILSASLKSCPPLISDNTFKICSGSGQGIAVALLVDVHPDPREGRRWPQSPFHQRCLRDDCPGGLPHDGKIFFQNAELSQSFSTFLF